MSMEQNGNHQNMATPLYCRNGCGFYAAQAFDGMCSKCYKDLKQPAPPTSTQPPTATSRVGVSSAADTSASDVDAVAAALSKTSLGEMNMNTSSNSSSDNKAGSPPDVETGSPTVTTPSSKHASGSGGAEGSAATGGDQAQAAGTPDGETPESDKGKKPKKNRCQECRKKVGLTGFQCHCGQLLCSLHRYSDTHHCTYDFKEKGQEEIRRNNPVIKGEKIQKI